jgi:hypothetical protein
MKQTRRKLILPAVLTLILTSIVLVLGNAHPCHLQSITLEIALFFFILSGCSIWTVTAKTMGKAWLRSALSLLIAFALQNAYLSWLHSDSFPKALLTQKARQRQTQIEIESLGPLELDNFARKNRGTIRNGNMKRMK